MKLLASLIKLMNGLTRKKRVQLSTGNIGPEAVRDSLAREVELLGEDRVQRQRYYESWASRESWLIYEEALPLLTSHVSETGEQMHQTEGSQGNHRQNIESLWEHIQQCVKQGLPPAILNPADPPEAWRAEPVELYRWAVAARLSVPVELEALLAFISTVVKRETGQTDLRVQSRAANDEEDSTAAYLAREQVLDAMLSLSLREILNLQVQDTESLRKKILHQIYQSSEILFDQPEPPLSRPAVHDLLDRSLEKAMLR